MTLLHTSYCLHSKFKKILFFNMFNFTAKKKILMVLFKWNTFLASDIWLSKMYATQSLNTSSFRLGI